MNAHTQVAKLRSLREIVAEYDQKAAGLSDAIKDFEAAGATIKAASCVAGEYGQEKIDTGYVNPVILRRNLLRSAWLHVWRGLNMDTLASVKDKQAWERSMADPPAFTLDNLAATFGRYVENPRASILRGFAEVFSDLDPAYKSHEKMKIGVKGLPKRVILSNIGTYASYGEERLRNIINALAAYQGKPLLRQEEMTLILKNGEALRAGGVFPHPWNSRHENKTITVIGRGVWLKRFANGNGHLHFDLEAQADINRALAEFYGDVLPDCPEADQRPDKPRASTAVSKDLQFYPTPKAVIDLLIEQIGYRLKGAYVLEPSCGDGRLMDALRDAGAYCSGVEVNFHRFAQARAKGHVVHFGNFLTLEPAPFFPGDTDTRHTLVVMNPPFYGRHYAKHVRHALRFLKPGGMLYAILPATARYDHGELDDLRPSWRDLPVGSFSESGTNINTTIASIRKDGPR